MHYDDWAPFYARIVQEFSFDTRADEASAHALAKRLSAAPYAPDAVWDHAATLLRGQPVIVLGAADNAADGLRRHRRDEPVIAADGATTASLEAGVNPTLIVSDLDGNVADEVAAVDRGSRIFVHAHGDNQPAIAQWLPRFEADRVAGTCQTRPVPPLRNHGGFTDGDRACFLAHALGASRIRLIGFELGAKTGRYSGTFDAKTKPRKLAWADRLLTELAARGAIIERL